MLDQVSDLKNHALKLLESVLDPADAGRIYDHLTQNFSFFSKVNREQFQSEYTALRLALATAAWENACIDHHLTQQEIPKIFLREVTRSFESPKALPVAQMFSDYLYAPDLEEEKDLMVALVKRFIHRLNLEKILAADLKKGTPLLPLVQKLVEIFEAFRNWIESQVAEKA